MPNNATKRVSSWADFETEISKLISVTFATNPTFLFRGQANEAEKKGTLLPSIARHPNGFDAEALLLKSFQQQAHLFVDRSWLPDPSHRFDWWALMQHYGVPTRLLDWSVSPYVATYNACCDLDAVASKGERKASDGVVYIAFAQRIWRHDKPDLNDESTYLSASQQSIRFGESGIASQRSSLQRGWFSVITHGSGHCHQKALQDVRWKNGDPENECDIQSIREITIPKSEKIEFLRQLHFRGITGQALFPGLDGLGKRLREEWMIRCHEHGGKR